MGLDLTNLSTNQVTSSDLSISTNIDGLINDLNTISGDKKNKKINYTNNLIKTSTSKKFIKKSLNTIIKNNDNVTSAATSIVKNLSAESGFNIDNALDAFNDPNKLIDGAVDLLDKKTSIDLRSKILEAIDTLCNSDNALSISAINDAIQTLAALLAGLALMLADCLKKPDIVAKNIALISLGKLVDKGV